MSYSINHSQRDAVSLIEVCCSLYPLFVFLVSITGLFDSSVRSFLVLPVAIIIPYLIGESILGRIQNIVGSFLENMSEVTKSVLYWIIGIICLFSLVLLLANLPLWFWSFDLFYFAVILTLVARLLKKLPRKGFRWGIDDAISTLNKIFGNWWMMAILFFIGLASAWFTLSKQTYPLTQSPSASDIRYTLTLTDGGIFFVGSGAMPVYTLIAALLAKTSQVHPAGILYAAPVIQHIVFAIGVYLCSFMVTRNNWSSTLASSVAVSVSVNALNNFGPKPICVSLFPLFLHIAVEEGERIMNNYLNYISYMLLAVVSSTTLILQAYLFPVQFRNIFVFLLIGILFLGIMLLRQKISKRLFCVIFSISLMASMIHTFEAPIVIFFFLSCITLSFISVRKFVVHYALSIIIFGCALTLVLAQLVGLIIFPDNFMFSRLLFGNIYDSFWFNMNGFQKWQWISNSFASHILLFSVIGCLISLILMKRRQLILATLFALMWFLFFLPEGHFWRVRDYMELFVAVLFSLVFNMIILQVSKQSPFSKKHTVHAVLCSFIIFILIPYAIEPRESFRKGNLNIEGYFSYDLPYEADAALWIYKEYHKQWIRPLWWSETFSGIESEVVAINDPTLGNTTRFIEVPFTRDTIIISDPYTMWLLSGYTGIDNAVDERVFIYESEYSERGIEQMEKVRAIFIKMFEISDLKTVQQLSGPLAYLNFLYFDGLEDCVIVQDSQSLDLSTGGTIEVLVRIDDFSHDINEILSKEDGKSGYYLWVSSSEKIFLGFNCREAELCSRASLSHGVFYHIVGTYDNFGILTLYINGELDSSIYTSKIISRNYSPLSLGSFLLPDGSRICSLNGSIALVRIYNRSLNWIEVKHNFNHLADPIEEGLVLWFDGQSIRNSNLYDKSGYNNNGKIYGAMIKRLDESIVNKQYEMLCELIGNIKRKHTKVLIVMSPRTCTWLKIGSRDFQFVRTAHEFTCKDVNQYYVQALDSFSNMKLVYSIQSKIYIYEWVHPD